jgi:hydroxymethylbilane synthase
MNIRPDLKIVQLRGNLDTRIRKLDEGQFDAIIVAVAGVKRLGLAYRITEILEPEICLPAIGQGAIGIECRVNDKVINTILGALNHQETSISVRAERALLRRLGGGCQVPIAAYARIEDGRVIMDGLVGSITGERVIKGHAEGKLEDHERLGTNLAEYLLSRGAKEILAEVYQIS